jgi:6-pyruvoyltetrahydropterin/6-carboxytetrahydropterin synthase
MSEPFSTTIPALEIAPVFEITKTAQFDAAHRLPTGPKAAYQRLHGHSFQVEATVRGVMSGDVGWVADLGELDLALKSLAQELDHCLLNEHPGLESPTLERLCLHFAERLKPDFPGLVKIGVSRPTVGERCVLDLPTAP